MMLNPKSGTNFQRNPRNPEIEFSVPGIPGKNDLYTVDFLKAIILLEDLRSPVTNMRHYH